MSPSKMVERFSDGARGTLILAQEESRAMQVRFIAPEHLLLGILHAYPNMVQTALGILWNELRAAIERFSPAGSHNASESFPFTEESYEVLEAAQRMSRELNSELVEVKHLLLAVLSVRSNRLDKALAAAGVDIGQSQARIRAALTKG